MDKQSKIIFAGASIFSPEHLEKIKTLKSCNIFTIKETILIQPAIILNVAGVIFLDEKINYIDWQDFRNENFELYTYIIECYTGISISEYFKNIGDQLIENKTYAFYHMESASVLVQTGGGRKSKPETAFVFPNNYGCNTNHQKIILSKKIKAELNTLRKQIAWLP